MPGRLEGKRVVITGGGGGAGAATARLFAAEGARLSILDLQQAEGEALTAELRADGVEAAFHHVDVSDEAAVVAAIAATEDELGGIDVLFNHAGTFMVKRLVEMTREEWDRLMAINVTSMFLTCRATLPGMVERGGGVILNTSSVSGLTANALEIAYCATKGAILQLTKGVAIEYREHGIRCNAICPGFIRTPHGDRERAALEAQGEEVSDDVIATVQGRICEPEDIAAAALSLVSDDTRFVNGSYLLVDNGWMALT
ncbi:MAG: SDR family oxidoreductase [Actinobacteria bacterium]|nr:SDR family oxidoreductase [Actinomycetota bacterium]